MIAMRSLLIVIVTIILASFASAGTDEAGLKFLEEKKKEEGVVTLPSGLLYKELQAGSGPSPKIDTPCKCHYEGKLIDGTEFDSSYKRGSPLTFKPNQVIKGWTEAMQLMKEGSKWELYIPSELGYGERGAGNLIPPNSVLVFVMELIEVKVEAAAQ